MSGFNGPVLLTPEVDGTTFQLVEEAVYTGSLGDSWTIPAGFTTDFASIPAAVSWAIPKLGAYSLAAIVHDLLCTGLNEWHEATRGAGGAWLAHAVRNSTDGFILIGGERVKIPTADAVDTDAILVKIARDYGVDPVTAALLWTGVRWGALANPARRAGWLGTAPKVLGLSLLLAPVLVPATVLAVVGQGLLWVARRIARWVS